VHHVTRRLNKSFILLKNIATHSKKIQTLNILSGRNSLVILVNMMVTARNDCADDKIISSLKMAIMRRPKKKKLGHWPSPQLDVSKPGHKLNMGADPQAQLSNTYN
jgi:hypothetical protein